MKWIQRHLIIVLALVCTRLAGAGNLELRDGTVYKNVMLISADAERMLIVHDGGGCQVAYKELGPGALSRDLQQDVAEGIKRSAERRERLERAQEEKQAFERAQREKGLVLFEGNWMKPDDRQKLLVQREEHRLAVEKLRVELEKEKLELRKQELLAERAKQQLKADRQTYLFYGYDPWQKGSSWHRGWSSECRSGVNIPLYHGGSSLIYGTGHSFQRAPRVYGFQK